MGPFTPVAVGGYTYVSKVTDEYTKWTAVYLSTTITRTKLFSHFQLFLASMVIPFDSQIVRRRADKGDEHTGRSFGSTGWRSVLSKSSPPPTRRRKLVSPNAWGGLCVPCIGACSQTAAFHRRCGGSCSWQLRTSRTGLRTRRSR